LAEATSDGPEIVMAALDLREVARRREQIAFMDFRRPDLYDQEPRVIGS
jgi:predicted amidohydrolase